MEFCNQIGFRCDIIWEYREMLFNGALMTLKLTVIAIFAGTFIGLFNAFARMAYAEKSNIVVRAALAVVRYISLIYVTLFRGTPLFVQVFIWYFVWMPMLIHPDNGLIISGIQASEIRREYGAFLAGALALSANAGAYITEIFRAGIQSIGKGQIEAARSLGLGYWQSMRYIILPQAVRRMLPPFGNEFITLLKDSSLVSAISVTELAFTARTMSGTYARYEEPYYTIALIYLVMTICLAFFFSFLEKRYKVVAR
ncbi:amino acid ABC transporter permease [Neisseria sp. Ec49-e6-T10]|uniref:amino acid ABC transporter permease n=1 Tax=Neisseria sp. Ec49-e6-T10 TaxID=3140744 RepID=UPI003EBC11BE